MMVAFVLVLIVVGGLVLFLIREQFSGADFQQSIVGVWFNEHLNIRILMYDVDSVFQGSVVWVGVGFSGFSIFSAFLLRFTGVVIRL